MKLIFLVKCAENQGKEERENYREKKKGRKKNQ